MHRVLCSTGALLGVPNGRNYYLLPECAERLRCDGYEFMLYSAWYDQLDRLSALLSRLRLPVYVYHCEKHIGEAISRNGPGDWEEAARLFEINCQMAVFLGARRMVMHLWDGMTSDQHIENNLRAYPLLLARARRHGLELMVENVVCNQRDPLTHWRELLRLYPQAAFTLDTKMAAFHQQLEEYYAPENRFLWTEGHIRHLHVNDYAGGYMDWVRLKTLHIGQGQIDFARFFDFVREVGYDGDYTVEATSFLPDGVIHFNELNRTLQYIREHINR